MHGVVCRGFCKTLLWLMVFLGLDCECALNAGVRLAWRRRELFCPGIEDKEGALRPVRRSAEVLIGNRQPSFVSIHDVGVLPPARPPPSPLQTTWS